MLIRSQNRKELHNMEKIAMIEVIPEFQSDKYLVEINHQKSIGEYSTKEKAIKVLDMISTEYERSLYSDSGFDQSANILRPYTFVRNTVFQMPTEEELDNPTAEDIINDITEM